MKKIKQVTSVVLTLVMALSMILSAMAAPEGELSGGSITIQDAVPGQSYNAYQILYLESYNTSAGAYSYKTARGRNGKRQSYHTDDRIEIIVAIGFFYRPL